MILRTIFCMIAIAGGTIANADEKPVMDVLILAGQSNMVGGATAASTPTHLMEYIQENPAVIQRSWINGEDWDDDWGNLKPRGQWIGPEMMLGHTLSEALPDRNLAFMKIAYNGTNLGCAWDPDGCGLNLFQQMCELVDLWTEQLEDMGWDVRFRGFIWVQGEGDCSVEWAAKRYEENLNQLIAGVRFATGNATLACVAAKMNPVAKEFLWKDVYHAGVDAVAAADENVAAVSCKTVELKEDLVHLSAEGMLALGAALGDAFLALDPYDTGIQTPCRSDVNNNGQVEVMDLLLLLQDLGPCP
ncbi:MAG: hypothetical protein CMJ40_06540 [Phycisphaerae bacterium]|nr:hypothetical protein [Phycisphaerae bacterium]